MQFCDTDTLRKLSLTAPCFYRGWFFPQVWENVFIEEDYLDSRVVEMLTKHVHRIINLKAKVKQENQYNRPLNALLFNMYNLVKLDLNGCTVVRNVDFLQIMYQLEDLNLSNCPSMSTSSMVRSVNGMRCLRKFTCQSNKVCMSAFMFYQSIRGLQTLKYVDCCDSGFMRPYVMRMLLKNCPRVDTFYFTTLFSLDDDQDCLQWHILLREKYPHVKVTDAVKAKLDEYAATCPLVKWHIWLHNFERDANL